MRKPRAVGAFFIIPEFNSYFCPMVRLVCCLIFLTYSASAQIRLSKLVLKPGEQFQIEGSDILVVDSLIMADSATILLNHDKVDNYIHAKAAIIGKGCTILGIGAKGTDGKNGSVGIEQRSPCRQGDPGQNGTMGLNGARGNNVSLYADYISITGSLTINVNGGDGGDGGDGGQGGGGGPGTRVCAGGDGGQGGNGEKGGEGGNGGNVLIQCRYCQDLQLWLGNKIVIKNYGGFGGLGGEAGRGGLAGLGPVRDGRNGSRGSHGAEGENGKNGMITFGKN